MDDPNIPGGKYKLYKLTVGMSEMDITGHEEEWLSRIKPLSQDCRPEAMHMFQTLMLSFEVHVVGSNLLKA